MSKDKKFSDTAASRYSLALYELAEENNSVQEIEDQSFALIKLIDESKDFTSIIKNPTNKKEDQVITKIYYTVSDLEAFDRIVESKEGRIKNQTASKNADAKNLKSNIDRSSIKIIDFDELKKRESIHNKQRIEKIKVVHFD